MRSAMEYPGPVNDYLKTELAAGRIAKLDKETRHMVIINRFGVIQKKGQPGKWQLITDLSFPPGNSVNDGIDKAMHYVSVDTAVKQDIKLGQGAQMAKIDIKHAYRNVPVHPEDRPLLAMQWEGKCL